VNKRSTYTPITAVQQSRDSSHWRRQGWSDVQTYHDGITIDAQAFDTLTNIFAKMLPDLTRQQNDAIFVKNVRDVYVATSPVFVAEAAPLAWVQSRH